MFTCFRDYFRCVRCGADSDAEIQTYLFRVDAGNTGDEYRVGDTAVIDGLDNFLPLYPWDDSGPLVLAVVAWECPRCSLHWQWAKVTLVVGDPTSAEPEGTIRSLVTLVPWDPEDLDGVHYVQPWQAELSDLWKSGRDYNGPEGDAAWSARPVAERCRLVTRGFRAWCREVAGTENPIR